MDIPLKKRRLILPDQPDWFDGKLCSFLGLADLLMSDGGGPRTVRVVAKGAGAQQAAGGYAEGTFVLMAGTTLTVQVGTAPSGMTPGWPGGGASTYANNRCGAGYSGVFTGGVSQANALVVAAGAGASGGTSDGAALNSGGVGGGTLGSNGTGSAPGRGGTPTAGGDGGLSNWIAGNSGSALQGGNVTANHGGQYPGAGGGGYWGAAVQALISSVAAPVVAVVVAPATSPRRRQQ